MKNKDLITIIELVIIIILLIIGITLFFKRSTKKIENIKSFEFIYSSGMEIYSYVDYKVDCKNNKCIAAIKPSGVPEEKSKTKELTKEELQELEDLLKKYKVERWDGFQKYNRNIMDGSSFNLHINMENNESIDASGYMKWPKNFKEVSEGLGKIFKKFYDEGLEEGIEKM